MGKKAKILIVDGERIIAEDIRKSLESFGHTVLAVVLSGEEALKEAEEQKPDLVLTEITLRGELDGIETAKQIRSNLNVPVVYLTALSDKKTVERVRKFKPSGYVLKPFKEKELQVIIENALSE